jgi:hypothetical protein
MKRKGAANRENALPASNPTLSSKNSGRPVRPPDRAENLRITNQESTMNQRLQATYDLYREGFRSMTLGRTLWKVLLIKLFVIFAVLKFFFFPDVLKTRFATDRARADHVLEILTGTSGTDH